MIAKEVLRFGDHLGALVHDTGTHSLWTRGLDLAHNAVWLEATASGLRGYFVPDDDDSTLYVYETASILDSRDTSTSPAPAP